MTAPLPNPIQHLSRGCHDPCTPMQLRPIENYNGTISIVERVRSQTSVLPTYWCMVSQEKNANWQARTKLMYAAAATFAMEINAEKTRK